MYCQKKVSMKETLIILQEGNTLSAGKLYWKICKGRFGKKRKRGKHNV